MTTTDLETGRYLAYLRDKARLRQNELAQKVGWSPAVLSRVESGERSVSTDELNHILEKIGSEEAMNFKDTYGRIWKYVERPQLGHPDESILWEAEIALRKLNELLEDPDIKNIFVKRLEAFREELYEAAWRVYRTEHVIAFVGDIGVGKSTAICRVADIEVQDEKTGVLSPVLEAGGGGVTICEVHLVQGPQYGLIVEPRSEYEIHREVREFATLLKSAPKSREDSEETGDPDSFGTSKEIERAIRNMSRLTTIREQQKDDDGNIIRRPDGRPQYVRRDLARELSGKSADADALALEIISRMNLAGRTRHELWYPEISGQKPLVWLKESFERVNNGRHTEFSIPQLIQVMVPRHILGEESLSIRLVDTKGIDRTAEREDIEHHFDEPNTLLVLCSAFNSTPSPSMQQLLEREKEGQLPNLEIKAAILALPHPGEALAVKDDQGYSAETVEDGYDLKVEQAEMTLNGIGIPQMRVGCFNSLEDNPELLNSFLMDLVQNLREMHSQRLVEVVKGANDLLENSEEEQTREILRQAAGHLNTWMQNNKQLAPAILHLEDGLLQAMKYTEASSVAASVRRQGDWPNFEYSPRLSSGARRIAINTVGAKQNKFNAIVEVIQQNPDYSDAISFVQQAHRIFDTGIENLFQKCQLLGRSVHSDDMKPDTDLWSSSESEWGGGAGYRERVAGHHVVWFEKHGNNQERLQALIESEWQQILQRISEILDEILDMDSEE